MKRLVTLVVIITSVVLIGNASAIDRAGAQSAATLWIRNHCGGVAYHCDWFMLGRVTSTGINEQGRAQWRFTGNSSETLRVWNPFLPTQQGCLYAGGVGPGGAIINGTKLCNPVY